MAMPNSTLRHRPVSSGVGEPAQVLTRRASRLRDQSAMTRPPRPVPADVQTEDMEAQAIHTDDLCDSLDEEEATYRTVPTRRSSRPARTNASSPTCQVPVIRQRQPPLLRGQRYVRPLCWIALGVLLLWLGYTGIWGIKMELAHWNNSWRFQNGHTPMDALTITGQNTRTNIFARNTGQQISVYLFLDNGKVQILSEELYPSAWEADTAEVVPSLTVDHGRLILTLTGDPQYGGLMAALTEKFTITSTADSYQIERIA